MEEGKFCKGGGETDQVNTVSKTEITTTQASVFFPKVIVKG